jgi:hypothetical protein
MPRTTLLDIPPEEQEQMLAALRRSRYGYLLALHVLLLCAAGHNPTSIAACLFCSRSSVYRMVRLYRAGKLGFPVATGRPTGGTRPDNCPEAVAEALCGGAAHGAPTDLWLVPDAVELCHTGGTAADETRAGGVGMDRAPLAPGAGVGVETRQAGRQR